MADYSSKVFRFEQGDNSFELIPEVLEFSASTDFPLSGTAGVLYIDKSTNRTYRWNDLNLEYVKIAEPNEEPRVVEANNFSSFPVTGSSATLYVDKSENKIYRWNATGNAYENITTDLTDFLSKANSAIVINGNTASVDANDGDYVVVENSTIAGVTDGFYQTTNAVLAGISFTSSDLSGVSLANGLFNHLRINTRAMIDLHTTARMKFIICPTSAADPISYLVEELTGDQTSAVVRATSNLAALVGLSAGALIGVCTRIGDASKTDARIDFMFSKQTGQITVGKIENINNSSEIRVTYHIVNPCPADADTLFKIVEFRFSYYTTKAENFSKTISDKSSGTVPSGYTPVGLTYFNTGDNRAYFYTLAAHNFVDGNTSVLFRIHASEAIGSSENPSTIIIRVLYARTGFIAS